MQELLFDDVLWVKRARQEHGLFVEQLRASGIEVLLVSRLCPGRGRGIGPLCRCARVEWADQ